MATVLFVGNKNFSSWSLRPWLCLRWAGIAFEERVIRLDQPGYGERRIAEVLAVSSAGTVPALEVDGLSIWDSLAIAEWAAEQVASGVLWPADPSVRAVARAATAEMHSGFAAVRRDLPMNLRRRCPRRSPGCRKLAPASSASSSCAKACVPCTPPRVPGCWVPAASPMPSIRPSQRAFAATASN